MSGEEEIWVRKKMLATADDIAEIKIDESSQRFIDAVRKHDHPALSPFKNLKDEQILQKLRRESWGL